MGYSFVGKAVKKLRLPTVNYESTPIKVVPAQQGDTGSRCLVVELYDDMGIIDVSAYTSTKLSVTLPDGTTASNTGEIDTSGKFLILDITSSMTAQAGRVACNVSVNGENSCLTSQTFYLYVAQSQGAV